MKRLVPDLGDRRSFLTYLLGGEILTRRGQPGPLARIWHAAGRRSGRQKPHSHQSGPRPRSGSFSTGREGD